jgi:hypothetical protein
MSDPPVTLGEIRLAMADEADRIAAVQAALVRSGTLERADPGQQRRQLVCEAVIKLIDRCLADREIVERLRPRRPGGAA